MFEMQILHEEVISKVVFQGKIWCYFYFQYTKVEPLRVIALQKPTSIWPDYLIVFWFSCKKWTHTLLVIAILSKFELFYINFILTLKSEINVIAIFECIWFL